MTPTMQAKLHELLNKVAERAYLQGYKDGKAHSKADPARVRVSLASIRRIK